MDDKTVDNILANLMSLRSSVIKSIIPKEVQQHFCASRKEALLGIRDIIQHTIDKLEKEASEETNQENHVNQAINITD